MAYKRLTEKGKKFIKHVVSTQSNKLSGKQTMAGVDFSRYFDVFDLPQDTDTNNFEWKMRRNSMSIDEYGNNLIKWFDKYAEEYDLDANILAAQTYIESLFKIWVFSNKRNKKTTKPYFPAALGLAQFVPPTIYENINALSDEEILKLTYGLTSNYVNIFNNDSSNSNAIMNIPILLQNLIDNPELMIKMQTHYMSLCADQADGLASSALIGYNRGSGLISRISYSETIYNIKQYGVKKDNPNYYQEGIDYVYKVFSVLGDENNNSGFNGKPKGYYFGYDIGMNYQPTDENIASYFDSFDANKQSKYDA